MQKIIIESIDKIGKAAQEFLPFLEKQPVVAFYGQMGAGKTTFIKAVCDCLGVKDMVNSPTFAIVNEYEDGQGGKVYHFDFYRVKNAQEAIDLGLGEYLYSGCPCLMEWPEIIEDLLPEDCLKVHIQETDNHQREISIE